jgi:CBS domain containing-hemolysin-like protein
MEDILEMLVGDIYDESDAADDSIILDQPGVYLLDGSVRLADMEMVDMEAAPHDEYETISGLLSAYLGHIPQIGEKVVINGWEFTVMKASPKAVHQVKAVKINPAPPAA